MPLNQCEALAKTGGAHGLKGASSRPLVLPAYSSEGGRQEAGDHDNSNYAQEVQGSVGVPPWEG